MTAAQAPTRPGIGVLGWAAAVGGIAAWMVHLTALASLAPLACDHPGVEWVMHGLTSGLAALTAAAVVVCHRLGRVSPTDGGTGPTERRNRFLARFGVLVAGTNLVLILAEGAYVAFIRPCG